MISVTMPDGSTYTVKELLGKGDSNAKLTKSDGAEKGYLTVGLSLAPANSSGYQVCSSASPGCTQACIFTAGKGQMKHVQWARIAKTIAFFEERNKFVDMLRRDLALARKRAHKQGKMLACRLNVFSDIQWEKIFPGLFLDFSDVQFYDYTKHAKRMHAYSQGGLPTNYHLTFSRSECNDEEAKRVLCYGGCNVTVVFSDDLPKSHWGKEVINGDDTDLRFLDPPGVIVGLKAKGRGKKDTSGFVVSSRVPLPIA